MKGKRERKKSATKRRALVSTLHDRSLILNENTEFSVKEEYKTLRTNILFSIPTEGCKVVGISSAQSFEGKSINCLNLAITFAEMNARVLLVDCDLRLPSQARLLALEAIPGVSNVLVGMNTVEQAIQKTGYPGVDALLSGDIPPNPAELLGSENMEKMLQKLSEKYDYIFMDLPPVNIVADVMVVSKHLSGLIFIIRAVVSKRDNVLKAIGKLKLINANIIGMVLTDIKNQAGFGGRSKYYASYSQTKSEKE